MRYTFLLALASLLLFESTASAAIVLENNLSIGTHSNPGETNGYTTDQATSPDVTSTGIGHGTGVSAAATGTSSSAGNNVYLLHEFDATSITNAITENDYFSFNITPNTGFQIDFTSFEFVGVASNVEGADQLPDADKVFFRTTYEGTIYGFGGFDAEGNKNPPGMTTSKALIDLSSLPSISSEIEFRLYGSGGAGDWGIQSFSFDGDVTAVPEPSSIAFLAIGCAVVACGNRRRRSGI